MKRWFQKFDFIKGLAKKLVGLQRVWFFHFINFTGKNWKVRLTLEYSKSTRRGPQEWCSEGRWGCWTLRRGRRWRWTSPRPLTRLTRWNRWVRSAPGASGRGRCRERWWCSSTLRSLVVRMQLWQWWQILCQTQPTWSRSDKRFASNPVLWNWKYIQLIL